MHHRYTKAELQLLKDALNEQMRQARHKYSTLIGSAQYQEITSPLFVLEQKIHEEIRVIEANEMIDT